MRLAGSAVSGAAVGSMTQALRWGLQLLSLVILARLLSPSDYGVLAMVLALVGIGEVLRDLGLSTAAIQVKEISQQERSNLFWISVAIGGLLTVLTYVGAGAVAGLYNRTDLIPVTQALSMVFLFNGIATQLRAQLVRDLRFFAVNASDLIAQLLGFSVAVSLAVNGFGVWSLVIQQLSQSVVLLGLAAVFARWRPSRPRRHERTGSLVRFGATYAATQVVVYVSANASSVLLGARLGAIDLGIFNRAQQVAGMPVSQLTSAATQVAVPVLSRTQTDEARYRRYWVTGIVVLGAPCAAAFGLLAAFAADLVPLVLGHQWAGASIPVAWLSGGAIFQILALPTFWFFVSRGLVSSNLRFSLIFRTVLIAATACGALGGVTICAAVTGLGAGVMWIGGLLWIRRVDPQLVDEGIKLGARAASLGLIPIGAVTLCRAITDAMPLLICTYVVALALAILANRPIVNILTSTVKSVRALQQNRTREVDPVG